MLTSPTIANIANSTTQSNPMLIPSDVVIVVVHPTKEVNEKGKVDTDAVRLRGLRKLVQ